MAQSNKNNPITFDTLSYAKRLKAAGFTQEQAEVQAETFLSIVQEQLVSKRDLKEVEKNLKVKIEMVKRDLKIWFGGMLVVAVTVLSGMMTLVVHLAR